MDFLKSLRTSIADAYVSLPLLLFGFTFFFGLLTSNLGMLMLFFGLLINTPALAFLSNEKGTFFDGGFDFFKLLKYIFAFLPVLLANSASLASLLSSENKGNANTLFLFYLFAVVLQTLFKVVKDRPASVFEAINPVAWLPEAMTARFRSAAAPTEVCSFIPNAPTAEIYTNPSTWVSMLAFLYGFIVANASALYKEPAPALSGNVDEAVRKERQSKLDNRVRNRKTIAAAVIGVTTLVFAFLFIFRYMRTPCEGNFLYNMVPVLLAVFTGSGWFSWITSTCGIRPADVLGIVPGLISPDLIDNPIVCVG